MGQLPAHPEVFRADWFCVKDGMYDLVIADFLDLSPEVFGQTKTGINGISVWGHDGNDFPVWMLRNCFQLGDDLRKVQKEPVKANPT